MTSAHDYDDPGKPRIAWNDKQARDALVDALVRDALAVLAALPTQEPGAAADAVGLLTADRPAGRPRPGDQRRRPGARHAPKTVHRRQDGFKAHVAVEPDTGLVTACQLSKASGAESSDATVGVDLLTDEPEHVEVLADPAYGSGAARATLAEAGHQALIKPIPLRAPVPGGFTADNFDVDHTARTVTCPNGWTRTISSSGTATFGVACRSCPLRTQCTTAREGRAVKIHEHEQLLRAARRHAQTDAFQQPYRQHRPMVERSIAWLVRGGNRKVRYRGIVNNDLWLHHRLAGLNLRRLPNLGLHQQHGTWVLA